MPTEGRDLSSESHDQSRRVPGDCREPYNSIMGLDAVEA